MFTTWINKLRILTIKRNPFTWYFFLFIAVAAICYNALAPLRTVSVLFPLLVQVVFWAIVILFTLSLIPIFILYFYLRQKKKHDQLNLELAVVGNKSSIIRFLLQLSPILFAWKSMLRFRIIFDNNTCTEKFSISKVKEGNTTNKIFKGYYDWTAPTIRTYQVKELILYIDNWFHFISIPLCVNIQLAFEVHPTVLNHKQQLSIVPQTSIDETNMQASRIKQNGDFLNHKTFEESDDVRRILWKVYARNRELMVRIPEVEYRNAEQVVVFASFYTDLSVDKIHIYERNVLNHYKNVIWTAYEKLVATEDFAVSLQSDLPNTSIVHEKKSVINMLSKGEWHQTSSASSFKENAIPALFIFSALNNKEAISAYMQQLPQTTFLMVPVSDSFAQNASWIKWIFLQDDEENISNREWQLSLIRPKIEQREKEFQRLVTAHNNMLISQ